MCSTKLPKLTLSLWKQSIQNKAEIPTWLELDSYLTERHLTLEAVDIFRSANFHHVQSKDTNRMAEFPKINSLNTRLVPIPKVCDMCSKKNHSVRICPRFLQMTVDYRQAYIQRKQLCSNCFGSSHKFRDCTSAHNCLTCQDRHHTLLGQYPPQFHTSFRPIQSKFPYKKSLLRILHPKIGFHPPPWMADVLEVLNPTIAESANRSIL